MNAFSLWLDRISLAFIALRDNRLRTFLSILGVAIGITAVMAVGTVSKGGGHLINSELETFGLKSVWVYRDFQNKDPHRKLQQGSGINTQDIIALKNCCSAVAQFSPMVSVRNEIIQTVNQYSNAEIKGVGLAALSIANDKLTQGRPFRQQEMRGQRAVAILGPTAVKDLFGKAPAMGKTFRIGLHKFTVIGILKSKSRDFLASIGSVGGQDANNRILIPYTTAQKIKGDKAIGYLHIEATAVDKSILASQQIEAVLKRQHKNAFTYTSETMASYLTTSNRIINGVTIIGIVAASISLLVGSMGIMNIMSTAVLERTREIGMRKALGASRRDILIQFLLEAVIISTLGGFFGLILGMGAGFLIAWLTGFPVIPSTGAAMIALIVSVLAGVLSGYLPAKRAASLHPVEALRYE
ncbi:MAG: ABC transporter permease [Arenicellales bacterium]